MDLTREIYWNVGHGIVTLLPMYLLVVVAIGLLVRAVLLRRTLYRQGQPLVRSDQPGQRIRNMLINALLQKKVNRKRFPGLLHSAFFWGFCLLLIGTGLIVLQADFTDLFFDIKFLKGPFYLLFSVTLDLAGLVCLLMLAGLLIRRYFFTPEGLESKRDDAVIHALLFAILITGFVIEGARMAVTELGTSLAYWSPIGLVFAKLLSGIGEDGLRTLHLVTWWLHLLMVMGFIILIPLTKLRHIYMTSSNYFFENLGPAGKLSSLDLEDEEAETFGAANLSELTWKDIFDTDACTNCMRCQNLCPSFNTGKPLSPMKVVNTLGDIAQSEPEANLQEKIGEEALWSCTSCGACQVNCPAAIEHVQKIIECRRALVLMEASFPAELHDTFTALENQSNVWGFSSDTRADWCKDLEVPIMANNPDAEILWFVGCAGSFDDKAIETSRAIANLLIKAGVDFAILGVEEQCNGDQARRCGNEYLAQMMIAANVETFKQYNPKRILTGCPHCYNTIKNEYPDFGASYDVVSHVEFIHELLESDKLTVKKEYAGKITFHDSCYFGRWNNIYEPPRKVIAKISDGGSLVEIEQHHDESMCCGAGGGRMFMEETIGERINKVRSKQAIDTGADTIAASCPFCITMLRDGMRDNDSDLAVKDLAELVDSVT